MIAIYTRKSKFIDKSESTNNQFEHCYKFCIEKFGEEEIAHYEDEGFSGKNENRPNYQKLVNDINSNKISTLVCYRLDRISRSVSDFHRLFELLEKKNVTFISTSELFETQSSMGKAMMSISSVFAQLERETIGQRIKDNLGQLATDGKFINNKAPFGYSKKSIEYADKKGNIKKANILEIDTVESEIVKCAFKKYLKAKKIDFVKRHFDVSSIKTRNQILFNKIGIKRILTHPFYCTADKSAYDFFIERGVVNIDDKDNWNGQFGVSAYRRINKNNSLHNDYSKMILAVGTHTPLISSKDWIATQKSFDKKRNIETKKVKSNNLLNGLIKCEKCGAFMRPASFNKNGAFYYVCETKEKSKGSDCNTKNIRGDIFEQQFFEELLTEFNLSYTNDFKHNSKINEVRNLIKEILWNGENATVLFK